MVVEAAAEETALLTGWAGMTTTWCEKVVT